MLTRKNVCGYLGSVRLFQQIWYLLQKYLFLNFKMHTCATGFLFLHTHVIFFIVLIVSKILTDRQCQVHFVRAFSLAENEARGFLYIIELCAIHVEKREVWLFGVGALIRTNMVLVSKILTDRQCQVHFVRAFSLAKNEARSFLYIIELCAIYVEKRCGYLESVRLFGRIWYLFQKYLPMDSAKSILFEPFPWQRMNPGVPCI